MPSPSSQNLRSAPQKQPSANTACSRPCGYGGFRLWPLTKWVVAVGMACARPGSASVALGSAVDLRMNSMEFLRAGIDRHHIGVTPTEAAPLRQPTRPYEALIPAIADQRLARPEQDHQHDPEHAHHGKHRLVEDDLDDAVPEPGHVALDPGAESLLAGLMDIVPELSEASEAQVLIGDPTRAVIDHEDESAGQQQNPDKSEKTADHAPPIPPRAPLAASSYRGSSGNSTSSVLYRCFAAARSPFASRR